jgi:Exonuclease
MSRAELKTRGYGDPPADGLVAHASRSSEAPGASGATAADSVDVYFSADVETDGPVPGPFSMLSFALVVAGRYDGERFVRPTNYEQHFYVELRPISDRFDTEALRVNGLNRERLTTEGQDARVAMTAASEWIRQHSLGGRPVLVAYPLSFDWSWLYWYFVQYSSNGSPFEHSRCFDLKTAYSVKSGVPICQAGRSRVPEHLRSAHLHTHHALDDAIEQAEMFANIFVWAKP